MNNEEKAGFNSDKRLFMFLIAVQVVILYIIIHPYLPWH